MAYITPLDLLNRLGAVEMAQLADESNLVSAEMLTLAVTDGDLSAFTEAEQEATAAALLRIERAEQEAATLIDAHLESHYQLPLEKVPLILANISADLTRFNLESWHHGTPREHSQQRYDTWVAFLEKVLAGKLTLGQTATQESAAVRTAGPTVAAEERRFTRTTLEAWR